MKKILIVEGNLKEENANFSKAGIQTHTQSLKDSLDFLTDELLIDVINPSSDQNIKKFNGNLHMYDGLIWGGSSLNIYNDSPEIRKQRLARQNVERVVKDQERKAILDAQMLYQYQEKEKNKNIKSSQKPELIPVLQDFDIPREKFKHAFKLSDEFKINNLTEYDLQKIRELIDVYDRFSSYIDNFQNFRFGVMDFFEELIIIYNYHL